MKHTELGDPVYVFLSEGNRVLFEFLLEVVLNVLTMCHSVSVNVHLAAYSHM